MPSNKLMPSLSRRNFMGGLSATGIASMAGVAALLPGCGTGDSPVVPPDPTPAREVRNLHFDLQHHEPDKHVFTLVVNGRHTPLEVATAASLLEAKRTNRFAATLATENITHHAHGVSLSGHSIQIVYVKRHVKGGNAQKWDLATSFIHIPAASVKKAFGMRNRSQMSTKAHLYGGSFPVSSLEEALDLRDVITPVDSAHHLAFMHPELTCFDPDSAAHIVGNIIDQHSLSLSMSIKAAGRGWSTNSETLYDPDTKKMITTSKGDPVLVNCPVDSVLAKVASAVNPSLQDMRQDTSLYANISGVTDSSKLKGKVSFYQDGATATYPKTSAVSSASQSNTPSYCMTDVCTGGGFKLKLKSVDRDEHGNLVATLECTNSYLRYLGAFVRYLDAHGNPIPISDLKAFLTPYESDGETFFNYPTGETTQYFKCLKPIGPELVIMGIPIADTHEDLKIPIPADASSFQIVCNTLGNGHNQFNYLGLGIGTTACFNLALPSLFLCMEAAGGYAAMVEMETTEIVMDGAKLFIDLIGTIVEAFAYDEGLKAFIKFSSECAITLLKSAAKSFITEVMINVLEGEAEDNIPFVGWALAVACSMAISAEIGETAGAALLSPWNYVNTVTLSHPINLTIFPDKDDPEGFPSVATHYIVTLTCQLTSTDATSGKVSVIDSATPIQITNPILGTNIPKIAVTIPDVPYGGSVVASIGFYSDNDFLAGYASGSFDNTKDDLALTITQIQVPLTTSTIYSHKEVTTLDASGNRTWNLTKTPPPANVIGQCSTSPGDLCNILCITDSNFAAAVGYAWQASDGIGQVYRVAGISTTATAQKGAFQVMQQGGTLPMRIVYDLFAPLAAQRNFYIDNSGFLRQIRLGLDATPDIDLPTSDRSWGKFKLSSDALLIHPNGKMISINQKSHKMEVLNLPQKPGADKDADVASVYGGLGSRPGLMNGPLCAAVNARGHILILESGNHRVQAFDTGGNPVKSFTKETSNVMTLKYPGNTYLDMKVEYTGYIFLLSYDVNSVYTTYLDIYNPDGKFLSRTPNFSGVRIVVSYWRDIFAANLQAMRLPNGSLPKTTEPSISRWIPST